MDPMALLDMERRTGISNKEIEEFANRMDLVSEAMEQIKNGTFDPESCTIPGYKSPAQEAREADERARKEAERRRKAHEKQLQEKADEREQWWRRAKLRFSIERGEGDGEEADRENANQATHDMASEATQWANRVLAAYKARDANDYSVWKNWVPEDPVTLEEKAAREVALEKVRNAEFEKNNPDFCQQFRDDLVKRQQTQRDREREAEKFKAIGNRHYKRREYEQAVAQYRKALEMAPFYVAVLTNMAQSFLRLDALDDSVEFSTRALYVEPTHVKALSRRAAVWHRQKQWELAARDMEKALQLDPENEDVVEQHSIVVGDYEDSITQRQLHAKLTNTTMDDTEAAVELRFLSELLNKMDEQEKRKDTSSPANGNGMDVAWVGYELLVPRLERNPDARNLMRTSGALRTLTQRLLCVLTPSALVPLVEMWKKREKFHDTTSVAERGKEEERTLTAMVSAMAACMTDSPRNQIVLYQDVAFRNAIIALLCSSSGVRLNALPARLREKLLRLVEEAVESKSWKKHVISSPAALRGMLEHVASPINSELSTAEIQALTSAAVSASSILLTIAGNDLHGVKSLASEPSCLEAITDGLQTHRRSRATLCNLLGVLTNISTSVSVRCELDASSAALRSRLVRSLLVLASHFTTPTLAPPKRRFYRVCAERALAALLNFSFQPDSMTRRELVQQDAITACHSVLAHVTASNVDDLMLVISRLSSLLCLLDSLPDDVASKTLHSELTSPCLLDKLYQICRLSLTLFAASKTSKASPDLWQAHAQIWCHVGWCISLHGYEKSTRAYLQSKQVLPAMVETLFLVNAQRLYRRTASEAPTGPERITGNVVKVLIAMLLSEGEEAFWTHKHTLSVLVDALQHLPDGVARKNVAILLAKLCQRFGDAVKTTVRELRGIEMMLSVSKSLATPASSLSKTRAVAF